MWRLAFNPRDAFLQQEVGAERAWRPARPVEGDDPVTPGWCVKAEAVAANTGRFRLDNTLYGAGGDGRVKGVAAFLKDADGRLRGQRV